MARFSIISIINFLVAFYCFFFAARQEKTLELRCHFIMYMGLMSLKTEEKNDEKIYISNDIRVIIGGDRSVEQSPLFIRSSDDTETFLMPFQF